MAYDLNPKNSDLKILYCKALLKYERFEDALPLAVQLGNQFPNNIDVQLMKAELYNMNALNDEYEDCLLNLLKLYPDNTEVYLLAVLTTFDYS
jgi:hypothetical protein